MENDGNIKSSEKQTVEKDDKNQNEHINTEERQPLKEAKEPQMES